MHRPTTVILFPFNCHISTRPGICTAGSIHPLNMTFSMLSVFACSCPNCSCIDDNVVASAILLPAACTLFLFRLGCHPVVPMARQLSLLLALWCIVTCFPDICYYIFYFVLLLMTLCGIIFVLGNTKGIRCRAIHYWCPSVGHFGVLVSFRFFIICIVPASFLLPLQRTIAVFPVVQINSLGCASSVKIINILHVATQ